jgi:uncharacterized membrane protein YfcA
VSVGEIVVIMAFTTVAATVQASTAIGFTLIAGPALVAIDPAFAPGPFLVVAQVVTARHIMAERHHADRVALRHAFIGLPVGLVAGLVVLELVPATGIAGVVGALTVVSCGLLLAGARPARSRLGELAGGGGCAFASVTAGLPGPPLIIAFNDLAPSAMRATVSLFVPSVATIGLVSLLVTGNFGWHEVRLTLWLAPGVALGLVLGRSVRPVIDRHWFRPTVLTVALLGGLALLVRQI